MTVIYAQNAESVTSETFDEDTVVINFLTGTYFSLRGSATLIWSHLQTGSSLDDILTSVGSDAAVARAEVQTVLDLLIAENCVIVFPGGEAGTKPRLNNKDGAPTYTSPVVEVFHDLQELIVIDPVHEVDEFDGWPHRPPPFEME
jgi:hypothetical protein